MSKYIKNQIEKLSMEIEALSEAADNRIEFELFAAKRSTVNLRIISMLSGAKMSENEDSKMKFSGLKKLPDTMELTQICDILDNYITNYETPYRLDKMGGKDNVVDDLDIPQDAPDYRLMFNKLNSKTFREFVVGDDFNSIGAASCFLTGIDVIHIAAFGEQLRKKKIRNLCIIIGGVSVVVISGGIITTAIICNNKKKSHDDELIVDAEIPEIDMGDDVDISDVEDDVPVVSIA